MTRKSTRIACFTGLFALWILFPAHVEAGKIRDIDTLCNDIRNEFVEAHPRYFAGPDPWTQTNEPPKDLSELASAAVYSEGPRIRWLVLHMASPSSAWFETTEYFFAESGEIWKRERTLEAATSNVQVRESVYFEKRKVIRTIYRHHVLVRENGAKENFDLFSDPRAPEYTSTADLPRAFSEDDFARITLLKPAPVCVPLVPRRLRKDHNPC